MVTPPQAALDRRPVGSDESSLSAVSWTAIFAGTAGAISLSIVLTSLGAGLGLTSISAWPNAGASATTFTISAGIGLIVVQWLSSALGGFITGRLRTKWTGVHTHEVFFRDTAHGFLAWALATIIGTALITAAASSVVGGGARAAATAAGGAAQAATSGVSGYAVDALFRSDHIDASASTQDLAAQATRILANGVRNGDVPASDRTYLAQLVAAKTGLSQADAQKRVDDTIAGAKNAETKARQAAEATRKATATFAIFTALSLLIGAFVAMAAAAFGGVCATNISACINLASARSPDIPETLKTQAMDRHAITAQRRGAQPSYLRRRIDVLRSHCEIHTRIEVVLDNEQFHLTHRGNDCIGLLDLIEAIPAILDHLANAPDLTLDLFQPLSDPSFFLISATSRNSYSIASFYPYPVGVISVNFSHITTAREMPAGQTLYQ